MTDAQKKLAKLQIESSEVRQKLNTLLIKDERTAEENTELETLTKRAQAIEPELRAALTLVSGEEPEGDAKPTETLDAETRERLELRAKSAVTRFVEAALKGRRIDGREAEYMAACGVGEGIPLELFEPDPREQRGKAEQRVDVNTAAPGTVGVNLQPIRPAVFAMSIAPRLGIEMPRVMSGTYAEARIDTSLSAAAEAPGDPAMASAATFAVSTATPKRISGRLGIRIEDIASVGQSNFESALRSNLQLVMSDALDSQVINGDGSGDNLTGIFERLTDPAAAGGVATFDAFVGAFADQVEGSVGGDAEGRADCLRPGHLLAVRQDVPESAANYKGELSAASYLMDKTGGWWTNSRMPDADDVPDRRRRATGHRAPHGPRGFENGRLPPLGKPEHR